MMLQPFFSFYGGKWRDAPKRYPAPQHGTIIEPFAGSAGYSVRYHDRQIILIEKDPRIAALWSLLVGASASDIERIPLIGAGETVDDLGVCEEARDLVGFWINKGASAPRRTPSSWMRSGIRPGSFWGERVRARIARQVGEISHWKVIEGDYTAAPDTEASWFIDPPYQDAGKHYKHGSSGIDYGHLGGWCKARRGQVIACEAEGADWLPFSPIGATKTTRKGKRSPEAVWVMPCKPSSPEGETDR